MKEYVLASRAACVLLLVSTLVVSGFAIHQLQSKECQIPVDVIADWRFELIGLLILNAYGVCFSIIWFFLAGNYKKDDKFTAIFIVITHLVAFCVGLYLAIDGQHLSQATPASMDTLFNSTKHEISKGRKNAADGMWIPEWLVAIQTASKNCCGVRTFRDYDEFWEPIQDHVPQSCCRSCRSTEDKCYTELRTIPFPDTVANNIKIDTGCYLEIIGKIKRTLTAAYTLIIVVTVFFGLSAFAFMVEFSCAYIWNDAEEPDDQGGNTGPAFTSEEQAWKTMDFFPLKNSDAQMTSSIGAASGETLPLENTTTSTDLADQNQSSSNVPTENKEYNLQDSQQAVARDDVQFIPEVNSLPEFDNEAQMPQVILPDQIQQQMDEEYYPDRQRHRRHRRRHEQ